MIKIGSTKDYKVRGIKVIVYGESGVGKTILCKTAPDPIIISAESGLLSLRDMDIPVIEISSLEDLKEAYKLLTSSRGKKFKTICIDSVSDISETVLHEYKQSFKDPRQAYGLMADEMSAIIKKFRNIKMKHVYVTAKLKRLVDEDSGDVSYIPLVPGQLFLNDLPYIFDLVLAYRISGYGKIKKRYLQTSADASWLAKDRSNRLLRDEKPDLSYIFNKIKEVTTNGKVTKEGEHRGK